MKLDLNIGDIILTGRFKNKPVEVKEFGTDEKGQPTINGRPILKFRIKKLIPENTKMNKKTLQQIIKEEVSSVLKKGKINELHPNFDQYYMNPKALVADKESGATDKQYKMKGWDKNIKVQEQAPKMKVYSWEKNFKEGLKNLDVAANMMKRKSPGGYGKIKKDLGKVQKALMTLYSQMKINSTEF